MLEDAKHADPMNVADEFLADTSFQGRWWKSDLYEPRDGGYRRSDARDFESMVFVWAATRFRGTNTWFVKEVIRAMEARRGIQASAVPPVWLGDKDSAPRDPLDWIPVRNGIVDVSGSTPNLLASTDEWFCLSPLPVGFDQDAKCPRFERFLGVALEGDNERLALVQEFAGYLLVPWVNLEKFLVCWGSGANGKSVLLKVLAELLGSDNVSAVPIQTLGERFQGVVTIGKLANITHELDRSAPRSEEQLKAYISGNPISFDRKNRDAVTTRPTARLVLSTNSFPKWNDMTGAIYRRQLLIPFCVTIPPKAQDANLAENIIRDELAGVFNWAIEGLLRLRRNQCFTESRRVKEAQSAHRRESNSAEEFLRTRCRHQAGAWIGRAELREKYGDWCREQGATPVRQEDFGVTLRAIFPHTKDEKHRQTSALQTGAKCKQTSAYGNIALI